MFIILFFISLTNLWAQAQVQNIQTVLTVDILHAQPFNDNRDNELTEEKSSTDVRAAEMMFYGPIDYQFNGVLNFAAHQHQGEMESEIHEGFIQSSTFIPGHRLKFGKFFLAYGRLNQFHQHDWPITLAPRVHDEIFSFEGISQPGLEVAKTLNLPVYIDITMGIVDGKQWSHEHHHEEEDHEENFTPSHPTFYIHPVTFFDFGQGQGLQLGASFLKRDDIEKRETEIKSLDITFKKRTGALLETLFQFELHSEYSYEQKIKNEGLYLYGQISNDQNWFYGFQVDAFQNAETLQVNNRGYDLAMGPSVTYKSSEFAQFRGTLQWREHSEDPNHLNDMYFLFQTTFILGAHPAHEF
jgi:hypothetical protein